MIALIIAVAVGILLSWLCQWLIMIVGYLTVPIVVFAMGRQSRLLKGVAIALSVLIRSYIALSFTAAVITYIQSATRGRGLAFAFVAWPFAFLLTNLPAWNNLRNYIKNFKATAKERVSRSGGPFEQARSRILNTEMHIHFMYTLNFVLFVSLIGFGLMTAIPALRTAGWGWVYSLVSYISGVRQP
ncbi:MAG: hypothetical protein ABIF87_01465 [Pseudomonadota bacterium]